MSTDRLPLLKEIEKFLVLKAASKEGDTKSIFGRPATFRSGKWKVDDAGAKKEPEGKKEPSTSEKFTDLLIETPDDEYNEFAKKTLSQVDEDFTDTFFEYLTDSESINGALREGGEHEAIKPLDDAFDQLPINGKDVPTLYRGGVLKNEIFNNLKAGDTISDKAFMSTTSQRETGEAFVDQAFEDLSEFGNVEDFESVLFVIDKGDGNFKALPLSTFDEEFSEELEFLLKRDSKFRVDKIGKTEFGLNEITMTILEEGALNE